MLSVSNLALRFGKQTLFENVSIKFVSGFCYGIIGANGSGKSTFLRVLSGEIQPDEGHVNIDHGVRLGILQQDHFQFDDCTVLDTVLMGREKLWKIQQERDRLYSQKKLTDTEGHRLAELEAEFGDMNGYAVTAGASEFLENLGIETAKNDWKMKQLTGGWKLRVLLAQVLYASPDVLLLDEPTNHLDIKTIKWLEDYLNAYEGTILAISHDRHFINNICTHIVDVDRSTITLYAGNYDFFKQASEEGLDAKMNENARKEKRIAELKAFVARFSANLSKSAQASSRAKLIDKIELEPIIPSVRQYPRLFFKPKEASGKDIIEVKGLCKAYDKHRVLKDFDLRISKGERVAVIGTNGLGKTTVLKCLLSGYEKPDGSGRPLSRLGLKPDKGMIRWGSSAILSTMPQDAKDELTEDMNALQWLKQYNPMADAQTIRGMLGRMLFSGDEQEKSVKVLSGGECQRLMLARMMMEGANTLFLDEPTNHMDLESIESLSKALIDFPGTVLFTTHDQDLISKVATKVLELKPLPV